MFFTAYGPASAARTGIKALMERIGAKKFKCLFPAEHELSLSESKVQRSRNCKKLLVLKFKYPKMISLALPMMTKMPQSMSRSLVMLSRLQKLERLSRRLWEKRWVQPKPRCMAFHRNFTPSLLPMPIL
ncbi:hypothetical protein EYC84_009525 [Monilinia fructicola]|uniref:Uncharacterized protein n=1 Tax=Monilinia fructicola TaxID=38448 RepID=A0A5M9JES4_MONFR|nr:hypothetical protein EYC84_009525 [Monilinia fructicola]